MIEHTLSFTLEQPPEQAFDFIVDFPNEPRWNPQCLSVEKTSDGPVGVGTTYLGRMKGVGKINTEVVKWQRPAVCATVERSRAAVGNFEFQVAQHDGGSLVTIIARLQPRGPMRLLQPVMRRMMARLLGAWPENVRRGIAEERRLTL
jgi:carbon monoxide dehydrogenase subunit G